MEDERDRRGVEIGRVSNIRQNPSPVEKTNGWRGLSASVSLLYLSHRGQWIYDPHWWVRGGGRAKRETFKIRKLKNEEKKTWTKR